MNLLKAGEGETVPPEYVAKLQTRFAALSDANKQIIRDLTAQAEQHDPISLAAKPSMRRLLIGRIMVRMAEIDGIIDRDALLAVCEHATKSMYHTTAEALSDLDWIQAERAWNLVEALAEGVTDLEYHPTTNTFTIKETTNVR
jgi:hypothetical protein